MSVLNQSGEEQVECPLCLEPLEVDDLNFFPCTCGYQICRFCWHRIRTDENGLCPACRKAYSEDPADFTPLSQEQVAKIKAEKRQRDQQRKAKLSENRKHLASVRVVQRNLVFVVGLPMRLADPEVLKKHEYFGKFGKIHKVVINQSTTYAGSQGPSASAYVTYMRSDDALRAIQSVNNVTIDGRQIKSSLGTTKYCSHFMKNQPCPKPDCMYLHDLGDPEASFTKEQMHLNQHQEYEKKLHESLLSRTKENINNINSSIPPIILLSTHNNTASPPITGSTNSEQIKPATKIKETVSSNGTNKESWPQLTTEKECKEKKDSTSNNIKDIAKDKSKAKNKTTKDKKEKKTSESSNQSSTKTEKEVKEIKDIKVEKTTDNSIDKLTSLNENSSFFSHNTFHKIAPQNREDDEEEDEEIDQSSTQHPATILTDSFPSISTTEDWASVFGNLGNLGTQQLCDERNHIPHSTATDSFFSGNMSTREDFRNVLEMSSSKLPDNIRDILSQKNNGYISPMKSQPQETYFAKDSGLEQHNMSKFFYDYYQKNGQKDTSSSNYNNLLMTNGLNGFSSQLNNYFANSDRFLYLNQKKFDDRIMNLKGNYGHLPSHSNNHYMNGDVGGGQNGYGGYNGSLFQNQPQQISKNRHHSEDELDFDPFKETQKGFAEMIANEQSYNKSHNSVRSSLATNQMNGVNHGQNSSKNHLPPPPGFVPQNNTHMNSFGTNYKRSFVSPSILNTDSIIGSKILPFLNMSNNQQVHSSAQNWNSYNTQLQHQQHKNLNSFNDWKDFDSAIVTAARHHPLGMPPARDHFTSLQQQLVSQQQQQQQQQQIQNGSLRSHDYTSNPFANFTQQLQQPSYNGYPSQQQQQQPQNLSWFTNELNSQISSPPGFRSTNQTSKQQEC